MIYHHLASKLNDRGRLRLDALLGDEEAVTERDRATQAAWAQHAGTPK